VSPTDLSSGPHSAESTTTTHSSPASSATSSATSSSWRSLLYVMFDIFILRKEIYTFRLSDGWSNLKARTWISICWHSRTLFVADGSTGNENNFCSDSAKWVDMQSVSRAEHSSSWSICLQIQQDSFDSIFVAGLMESYLQDSREIVPSWSLARRSSCWVLSATHLS